MRKKCKYCNGTGLLYYPAPDINREFNRPWKYPSLVETGELEEGFCSFCSGSGNAYIDSEDLQV